MDGPTLTKIMAKAAAMMGFRLCYCPEERRCQWQLGYIAGPDKVVGTEDDLPIPANDHTE